MAFLLDTNIISYLVRDPQGLVAARVAREASADLHTSIVVIGEIAFGFARQPSPRLEKQTSQVLRGIQIVDLDHGAASLYGSIRASLQRSGTPIGGNDLWIAAHAMALNATLITANEREFRRVPGLRVENWTI